MPGFEDLKPDLIAWDVGFLWLVFLVGLCCCIVGFLLRRIPRWHKPFKRAAQVSFFVLTTSLPALLTGVSGLLLFTRRWMAWLRVALRSRWALVLIVLLALLVRLPRINESLWYDEAFSAQLSELPLERFAEAVLADVHPPTYYLILAGFRAVLGNSPVALRVPSLLFGLLSLLVLARLGTRLVNREVGRMAALLMAVSPAAAYYSIEARSYALLTLELLLAVLCVVEGRRWRFALLVIALCWTHNFGFLYAAVFAVVILYQELTAWGKGLPSAVLSWFHALAVAALGAAAWLPFLMHEAHTVGDGYWMYFSPASIVVPLVTMTVGTVPGELVALVVIGWLVLLSAAVAAGWRELQHRHFGLLAAICVGVPLLATIISGLWQPVFLARALLPAMQLLWIPVAILVLKGPAAQYWMRWAVIVLLAALVPFYSYKGRPDYRALLYEHCGQYGDPLYHTSMTSAFVASQAYPIELPQLDWALATDQGDTFDAGASEIYGFKSGEIEELAAYGTVCIVQTRTPLSKDDELAHLSALLATYPYTSSTVEVELYYQLVFYRVEVG